MILDELKNVYQDLSLWKHFHNLLHVQQNCLSQVLEQSRSEGYSAITNLYKNIPERSISYLIYYQIRNFVRLLNLAPNRSF